LCQQFLFAGIRKWGYHDPTAKTEAFSRQSFIGIRLAVHSSHVILSEAKNLIQDGTYINRDAESQTCSVIPALLRAMSIALRRIDSSGNPVETFVNCDT